MLFFHARSWFRRSRGGLEFWERFGGGVIVNFLACLLRVANGLLLRSRFFVVGMLRKLVWPCP